MHEDRIGRARQALRDLALDALLVTHPPNLRYLTGLNASAGALILAQERCTLLVDFRYATAATQVVLRMPGASVVVADSTLDTAVADALAAPGGLKVGIEAEHLPVARLHRIANQLASLASPLPEGLSPAALVPTERIVERLRAVKDAAEIATLREAGRMLSQVARRAPEWVAAGRTEQEVAASVESALRSAGFERPAFETIVASGPNGALPHARPTSRKLANADGVVLDFGGVYDGYCVDLTRTLHIGPMPPLFRRLFEAVRDAHAAAIAAVRPGVAAVDIDAAARGVLDREGFGAAFGHGTGHGLGLEVHEEPRISRWTPRDETVVEGMVFTIEPGAYLPGVGGVRLEDDVLVTAGGCELLTDVPIDF